MTATWRDEQSGKGEHYGYDTANQLTSAVYNADNVWTGNPQNASRSVSYTYTPDTLNRQSVNDNGAVTTYSRSAMNQYQSVAGTIYNYDYNFNLREGPNWWGVFDAAGRLTAAGGGGNEVDFTYDGLGRCVRRVVHPPGGASRTLLFTYDGWKPVMEWDEAGNCQAWNIYGPGPDEILWRCQAGVGNLRYHHDVHGNVAFLLDYNGAGIERYTYDAFGQPTITDWNGNVRSQSAYGNRFLFQGREYIPELGIYDYRHRMYHPGLGRFMQSDPTGFDAGDMNLYRYCDDDPVDRTDPTGLYVVVDLTNAMGFRNTIADSFMTPASTNTAYAPSSSTVAFATIDKFYSKKADPPIFNSSREAGLAGGLKAYKKVDKSGVGGPDNPEYGGLIIQRTAAGRIQYSYTGPFVGQQGRLDDKYRHMRANYLTVVGRGSLQAPQGWQKIGWYYAHPIQGNTIPHDDIAVAREYHMVVVGLAPPLRRGEYYNPENPMISYYPR